MVTRAVSTVPLSGHSNLLPNEGGRKGKKKRKRKKQVMSRSIRELEEEQEKRKN